MIQLEWNFFHICFLLLLVFYADKRKKWQRRRNNTQNQTKTSFRLEINDERIHKKSDIERKFFIIWNCFGFRNFWILLSIIICLILLFIIFSLCQYQKQSINLHHHHPIEKKNNDNNHFWFETELTQQIRNASYTFGTLIDQNERKKIFVEIFSNYDEYKSKFRTNGYETCEAIRYGIMDYYMAHKSGYNKLTSSKQIYYNISNTNDRKWRGIILVWISSWKFLHQRNRNNKNNNRKNTVNDE